MVANEETPHGPAEDLLDEISGHQIRKGPSDNEPVVYLARGIFFNGGNYLWIKQPAPSELNSSLAIPAHFSFAWFLLNTYPSSDPAINAKTVFVVYND